MRTNYYQYSTTVPVSIVAAWRAIRECYVNYRIRIDKCAIVYINVVRATAVGTRIRECVPRAARENGRTNDGRTDHEADVALVLCYVALLVDYHE